MSAPTSSPIDPLDPAFGGFWSSDDSACPLDVQLINAISRFDQPAFDRLLAQGANPRARLPVEGYCAIHAAVMAGNHRAFDEILRRCPGSARQKALLSGRLPLHAAAERGNLHAVKILLPLSNPKAADRGKDTALALAASEGWVDIVELLAPLSDPAWTDSHSRGAVDLAICFFYDESPFQTRFRPAYWGLTPFFHPLAGWSRHDCLACFHALAPLSPCRAERRSVAGDSWLAQAIPMDRHGILSFLIQEHPPAPEKAQELLGEAIALNAIECARLLIPLATLDQPVSQAVASWGIPRSLWRSPPLVLAAGLNRPEICQDILAARPDLALRRFGGRSLLAWAGAHGSRACLPLFLQGGSLFGREAQGLNAFDEALAAGHLDCAQALWEAMRAAERSGLPPEAGDPWRMSVEAAAASGSPEVLAWLAERLGRSLVAAKTAVAAPRPGDGLSPLHMAVINRAWPMASALAQFRAQALSDPDQHSILASLISGAEKPPKTLAKTLVEANAIQIFRPAPNMRSFDPQGDLFGACCRHGGAKLSAIFAKAALRSPHKPAGWEERAWFDLWLLKKKATRPPKAARLFLTWLRQLPPGRLDAMMARACAGAPPWVCALLLDAGASIDALDADGLSPCAQALRCGRIDCAALLHDLGADPLAGAWHQTPLAWASACHVELAAAMLARMAAPPPLEALRAAWSRAEPTLDHCALFLPLLPEGEPLPVDQDGRCLAMRAAMAGHCDAALALAPRSDGSLVDVHGLGGCAHLMKGKGWEHPHFEAALEALMDRSRLPHFGVLLDKPSLPARPDLLKHAMFTRLAQAIMERRELGALVPPTPQSGRARL